jgi:RNA polymerase sigma factor (sigma-70 family)
MSHPVIRDYLRVAAGDDPTGPADTELLAHFAAHRDEASFELLVWRHASLVQRICKGVLGDHHAAEDAAQAAFLILARKAHTFSGNQSVIGWLYKVARRAALRLAKNRGRPAASSSGLDSLPIVQAETTTSTDELEALCIEVDGLPERYKVPILLCFFEGLTHAEAARRTGWAIGTVAGRLARAKDLLARRLSRKGVGMATVVLAVPAGNFVGSTARAAAAFALRGSVVPGVESNVTHLAEGVLKAMTATRLKFAIALTVGCLVASGWALTVVAGPHPQPVPEVPAATQPVPAAQTATPAQQPANKDRVANQAQANKSKNRLKQILIAFHAHAQTYGAVLPHDITDLDGKPLLSWRVAILPFIEEAQLYSEFKLNEPWDSEHNKKLLTRMPPVYRVGFEPKGETKTYCQVFAGPETPFETGKKISLLVPDGTSNTLGVVEAGPPVEWTKPADIAYHSKKPFPKLDLPFKNTIVVATLDGAAYSISPDLDQDIFRRLIERADGQQVPAMNKLEMKFQFVREDIEQNQAFLSRNEKLLAAIEEQIREQQRLLAELAKNKNPAELPQGTQIDPEWAKKLSAELSSSLSELKKQTKELKRLTEEGKK